MSGGLLIEATFQRKELHTDGVGTLRPRCASLAVFGSP